MSNCCCTGKCKVWPYTCSGITPTIETVSMIWPPPQNPEFESFKAQVIAQEHTINQIQKGIEKCFERIENLESLIDIEKIRSWIFEGAQTHLSILKCEKKIEELTQSMINYDQDIWKHIRENESKKPHECPICEGSGKRYIDPAKPLSGFEALAGQRDLNGMQYLTCHPCEGHGIVWG